jgi:hypothetical protein
MTYRRTGDNEMGLRHRFSLDSERSSVLSPSDEHAERESLVASLVLTTLLTVVVPVVALTTGLSVLPLVGLAGVVYAGVALGRNSVFEGLGSALFVLVVFNANVPLVAGPGPARADLLFVDAALVPLVCLLAYRAYTTSPSLSFDARTLAVACLGGFVAWSFAAAVVANGQSRPAAFMFGVFQLRNLLLLLAGAFVVRETSVWCGIDALVVGTGGNLAFALAEALKGNTFGLTVLGEIGGGYIGRVVVGDISLHSGLYPGAFAGSSRVLTGIVLLSLPVAVLALRRRRRWGTIGAVGYVLAASLLVRISSTDAGLMALLLTLVIAIAVLLYDAYRGTTGGSLSTVATFAFGIAATVWLFALRQVRDGGGGQQSGIDGGESSAPNTGGPATATDPTRIETHLTELLTRVPLVSTNTFSVRLQQYAAAIRIGGEYPLFGLGGFNFGLLAGSYGLQTRREVHNTFFAYLAATGIPGLLAYLATTILMVTIPLYRALVGRKHGLVWGMVAAGMIGFHAFSFWVTLHTSATAYGAFWALSGLVIGYEDRGNG